MKLFIKYYCLTVLIIADITITSIFFKTPLIKQIGLAVEIAVN